ncbi:MAG TPA: thioredoxin fold domain-containing protein [Fimbriimonadaceae bacterium]|nr:thioredoxin fold domain-containing protein [Fimbriimonadaceae bacterium]
MKRSIIAVLLLCFAVAGANAAGIAWAKAYSAAKESSKSTGKLIMIDFYTDWCGWCKKLDADTYPDPAVVDESTKFVPIKLNAEKDADGIRLAKKFKVDGYPTILFIDSNENLVYKIVGYAPPKDFAVSMEKAATVLSDKAKYQTALAANPNDSDAMLGLAGVYASTGNVDKAAELTDRASKIAGESSKGKLLDAYNAVGDGYQNASDLDKAIPFFKRAIDPAFPTQSAYARISISVCYLQANKPSEAIPYLKALLDMGKEADQYRDQAKQMLAAAQKGG